MLQQFQAGSSIGRKVKDADFVKMHEKEVVKIFIFLRGMRPNS